MFNLIKIRSLQISINDWYKNMPCVLFLGVEAFIIIAVYVEKKVVVIYILFFWLQSDLFCFTETLCHTITMIELPCSFSCTVTFGPKNTKVDNLFTFWRITSSEIWFFDPCIIASIFFGGGGMKVNGELRTVVTDINMINIQRWRYFINCH